LVTRPNYNIVHKSEERLITTYIQDIHSPNIYFKRKHRVIDAHYIFRMKIY